MSQTLSAGEHVLFHIKNKSDIWNIFELWNCSFPKVFIFVLYLSFLANAWQKSPADQTLSKGHGTPGMGLGWGVVPLWAMYELKKMDEDASVNRKALLDAFLFAKDRSATPRVPLGRYVCKCMYM